MNNTKSKLIAIIIGAITCIVFLASCGGGGSSSGGGGSSSGGGTVATPPIETPPQSEIPNPGKDSVKRLSMSLLADFPQPHKDVAINIQERGVRTTNSPEQNSDAIEALFNSIEVGTAPPIYAPGGEYRFARMIHIDSRPVHFFGDSGSPWALGTRFYFPPGIDGIKIERTKGYMGTIVQNIAVIGQPNSEVWASGFAIKARAKIIGCSAKGFSHNGIDFWANIEGEGTDASGSLVFDCVSLENVHDGFFAGRVDANAISFLVCDARDNGRYGFNDDSFLGNWFEKCMAHYNKAGDFFVRDKGNARSTFRDCYSEGNGAVYSQLGQHSTVIGGTWGAPFDIGDGVKRYKSYIPQ